MLIIYGAIKLNTWEKFVQFNRIGNKNIIIKNQLQFKFMPYRLYL